jgi:hypothetical protein
VAACCRILGGLNYAARLQPSLAGCSLQRPLVEVPVLPGCPNRAAEKCVEYLHACRLYQGEHSLRGLPEEAWLRQALQDAQVRRRQLDVAALAAEVAAFSDQVPAGEEIGAKLNRLLFGFLETEILPQAIRAAELGIDPMPWLDVVAARPSPTRSWRRPRPRRPNQSNGQGQSTALPGQRRPDPAISRTIRLPSMQSPESTGFSRGTRRGGAGPGTPGP